MLNHTNCRSILILISNSQPSEVAFFSELCWGEPMVAYTKPQERKKEKSDRLRGERIRSSLLILDLKDDKL